MSIHRNGVTYSPGFARSDVNVSPGQARHGVLDVTSEQVQQNARLFSGLFQPSACSRGAVTSAPSLRPRAAKISLSGSLLNFIHLDVGTKVFLSSSESNMISKFSTKSLTKTGIPTQARKRPSHRPLPPPKG